MAAPWPPNQAVGNAPLQIKSFAEALSASSSCGLTIPDLGVLSAYRGEPALLISKAKLTQLAEPFKNALVGHFAFGRPSMEMI